MEWIYALIGLVLVFGVVVFRGAPYVPSHRKYVRQSFQKLYKLSSKDVLVDIGSGDGVIMRLAAERGARAVGYELNPILVMISKLLSWRDRRIDTKWADFWLVKIPPETTIVYAFAVTRDIERIAKKIQETADEYDKPLWLMTYGAPIASKQPVRSLRAHELYLFEPLHSKKP